MARTTPNLGLKVWDLGSDEFTPADLEYNWDAIDADYSRARPASKTSSGAALPGSPADGDLFYLTSAASGFPTKTLVKYDGTKWVSFPQPELHGSLPVTGNFAGRVVLLTASAGGFPAWSQVVDATGSGGWQQTVKGVDVSATVPVTNNFAGRVVVLTGADGGFLSGDMIRYNGSAWHKIGPQAIPPGTELVSSVVTTDITTTNTVSPYDTAVTFGAVTYENVKYYLDVSIPWVHHSVTNAIIVMGLYESTTLVGNLKSFGMHVTALQGTNIKFRTNFTPTAASHTYLVRWGVVTAGTASIHGSTRGNAEFRIIKA